MPRHGKTLGQPILRWLGKREKCVKQNPFTSTASTFEAVQLNDLTIRVGDFVLVNADADEPDTVASCDVARIEHLFESAKKGDKFRANVQWYSKPPKIPESIDTDHMDDEHEVVEDYRKFDSNVSVESIYKTCHVINAYEDEIPEYVHLKVEDRTMPAFVCRYRLDRKNDKYYVEPVLKLDVLNPEDSSSCSGSVDVGSRHSYRYLPNTIIEEAPTEGKEIKSARKSSKANTPKTPKSDSGKIEAKLRSALRKCSIDSDSEAQRYSSPGKRKSSINQDSDFENSPRSTPKKNTLRSSRKNETPLKSNHINTLASKLDYSSGENDGRKKSTRDSYDVVEYTPAKNGPATPSRKRRISSTSSEESLEPRSRSVSPEIDRVGPPAAFKLYETKGQTFVIKTPVSIEKKRVSKKLDEMDISGMLSSDDSDKEAILEKFEKNGTKIVARSKSDNTGFELLKTPNKNVNFSDDNVNAETPKSARRNLSGILNVGDRSDARKDLLMKKLADKREDASLRIKLRRSSEQSSYKIDSDSDGGVGNRGRRRNVVGTPKSILKVNSKGPGTPSVQFSNRDEIKEFSPNSGVTNEFLRVEIKLKRVDSDAVRKSPRIKTSNPKYLDHYEVVSPTKTNSETPKKRSRRTIHQIQVDDDDDSVTREEKKITQQTRRSIHNIDLSESQSFTSKKKSSSDTPTRKSKRKDEIECSEHEPDESEEENYSNRTPRRTRNSVNNRNGTSTYKLRTPKKTEAAKKEKAEDVALTRTPRSSRKQKTEVVSTPTRKGSKLKLEPAEPSTPKRGVLTPKTQTPSKLVKNGLLTPSMRQRNMSVAKPATLLQEARARLHISAVPKSLPCREEEFNSIYTFLERKLMDSSGGCLYISGVPGTGKTATVNEVIRCLEKSVSKGKVDNFELLEINGMKLTEPRQAYVEILKQLTGKKATWEQAHQLLDKRFTNAAPRGRMTVLVVDELDILCNKRQDVVYNLLDWPAKSSAQLVVITIANTMDLPERVLMGRVTSRLGLTRLTFQPYTFKQLQEIVTARLNDSHAFKSEAIQLVARKVAAVSGDARRALDICRRATEVAETNRSEIVSMQDVNEALTEMIASAKVQAIKHCSEMEQTFLQAVCAEVTRTGVEEVTFNNIYIMLTSLCSLEGLPVPSVTEAITICARLGASRLLICEHSRADIHQRVLLNVSSDDVHFAMQNIDA